MSDKYWKEPLKWDRQAAKDGRPHKVFSSSMCDIFEDHPVVAKQLVRLWDLIRRTPNLEWLLLTKRADRIAANLPPDWGKGYKNVWLGTTVESEPYIWRAEALKKIPVKVRFISYEPALGPLDALNLRGLHWIIYGGESGAKRRLEDPQWARDMRDRCLLSRTAFFYKQSSGLNAGTDPYLDGVEYKQFPRY